LPARSRHRLVQQTLQVRQRSNRGVRLPRQLHLRAHCAIKHPRGKFAPLTLVVFADLAAKRYTRRATDAQMHQDVAPEQRVPPVVHPEKLGLVGIVPGTCSTPGGLTKGSVHESRPARILPWSGIHDRASSDCPSLVAFIMSTAGRHDRWTSEVATTGLRETRGGSSSIPTPLVPRPAYRQSPTNGPQPCSTKYSTFDSTYTPSKYLLQRFSLFGSL
jgi:hypothetical protein